MESGKPLKESKVEVEYGASFIEWSAEQALRTSGEIFESPENKKNVYNKTTDWCCGCNHSMELSFSDGYKKSCSRSCIRLFNYLKPSELTPITALELGKIINRGWFSSGSF